jgi:hypothetical protein
MFVSRRTPLEIAQRLTVSTPTQSQREVTCIAAEAEFPAWSYALASIW